MIRRAVTLIALALCVTAMGAADVEQELARAQQLAWSKHFAEAAAIYEAVLRSVPQSHDATLGLARVRLWQGRYGEARQLFRRILARNSRDGDAAEGAATAAYWSGDYRTAEREFAALAAMQPERESVRKSLDELRAASATTESLETSLVDDDQPFRAARTDMHVSVFSDPLTRWDATLGGYAINSVIGGRHVAPFIVVQNETVLPSLRLTITPSLGAIRTPDSRTRAIGGLGVRYALSHHSSLTLSFARRELMSNATRLYPFEDVSSLRWQHAEPWLASIGVERDRFSDHNTARAADTYVLCPIFKRAKWRFATGVSALVRDTSESRFFVTTITAQRDPSGGFFDYSYRGAYDPYWTPLHLREARLIFAIDRQLAHGATARLQADGGEAHDDAVVFWPGSGASSFPSQVGQSLFKRSYSPWRVRLTSQLPVARGMTLDIGFEHAVTAFYRANTFHAALVRRR